MNTSPLIVYTIYLDEGPHSRAPAAVLGGQARGYFHSKVACVTLLRLTILMMNSVQEEQLLILSHAFLDLSDRDEKRALQENVERIRTFLQSAPNCRFVLLLQTHSNPSDGLLHFSSKKCTTLDEVSFISSFQYLYAMFIDFNLCLWDNAIPSPSEFCPLAQQLWIFCRETSRGCERCSVSSQL
jgi:hypothetical protein